MGDALCQTPLKDVVLVPHNLSFRGQFQHHRYPSHSSGGSRISQVGCQISNLLFRTARKRSLRRLCFYRCVSVHRGHAWQGKSFMLAGGHPCWGHACWGHAWQGEWHGGGMHGRGHVLRGVCMAGGHAWQGGMHGRGHAWCWGMCGGGCAWWGACVADTMRYSQWAGGEWWVSVYLRTNIKDVRPTSINHLVAIWYSPS